MTRGAESPSWPTARKKRRQSDGYKCGNCDVNGQPGDGTLDVHHIVPKVKGGTDKQSNLRTLCKDCHNAIHTDAMAPTPRGQSNKNRKNIYIFLSLLAFLLLVHITNGGSVVGIVGVFLGVVVFLLFSALVWLLDKTNTLWYGIFTVLALGYIINSWNEFSTEKAVVESAKTLGVFLLSVSVVAILQRLSV